MHGREICDLLSVTEGFRATRANHPFESRQLRRASDAAAAERGNVLSFRSGWGGPERVSRRGAERPEFDYRSTAETKEATIVQIAAHSPSDNSNAAITAPGLISRRPKAGFPSGRTLGRSSAQCAPPNRTLPPSISPTSNVRSFSLMRSPCVNPELAGVKRASWLAPAWRVRPDSRSPRRWSLYNPAGTDARLTSPALKAQRATGLLRRLPLHDPTQHQQHPGGPRTVAKPGKKRCRFGGTSPTPLPIWA